MANYFGSDAAKLIELPIYQTENEARRVCPFGWTITRVEDAFEKLETGRIWERKELASTGLIPVLDQSLDGIHGFHSGTAGVQASVDMPVVTFANHTCVMRFVSRPFSVIQNVFPLIGRAGICETQFLFYWLNGRVHIEEYKGHFPDLRRLWLPLPTLMEQRAIASLLGALDDKIEFNQRQQSTLLGICHAAFDVALMNGADVMKVEDMVRFRNNERKPLSAMERSGMERRYPYYGATGIFDFVDGYLFDDVNILIGEDGSVVNDDGTPVAQMAWGKYWVNNHAHVLSGKAVSTELAYIALARSDVRSLITGAVQLKINMGNLKSLEVALPSVEVRGGVNREIQENFALWRAKSDESKMLAGLRDALLPELLSGRLRVNDAELMMENV